MDGEVDLDAILTFIKYLRSHGFRFASVTYDQYQSRHSIQSLEKAGFTGGTFSVGLDAYKELRRRVVLGPAGCSWYDYPVLIHELRMLQRPAKPDAPPDHPVGGTNDTAEVAAGCAGKAAALLVGKAVRRSVRGSTWTPWMG